MKKLSFILIILLISIISSCSYHPDYIIGSAGDYEELNSSDENPLYKGKGYYKVAYCPDGVYKDYKRSFYFDVMEDGELYFDKSTYKSGFIRVYKKSEEQKSYGQLFTGSIHDHETVNKGDKINIEIEMEPYFTTKKNEKFYDFTVYLAAY